MLRRRPAQVESRHDPKQHADRGEDMDRQATQQRRLQLTIATDMGGDYSTGTGCREWFGPAAPPY